MTTRIPTRPSPIDGLGQFAADRIQNGQIVVVWSGLIVPDAELRRIKAAGKLHSSVAVGEDVNILFGVFDSMRLQTLRRSRLGRAALVV
jgi:hypothetical protein